MKYPKVDGEIVAGLIGWVEYEHMILEGMEPELTVEELSTENSYLHGYLGKALKQLGFKTIKDWQEKIE
jgi:hypothetical protein